MIEKILDKYYIKKMKIFLDREMLGYYIDHRYIKKNDYLILQIKREEFNDNQYVECLTFNEKDVFIDLCNQKELRKVLKARIEMYDKSIREKY